MKRLAVACLAAVFACGSAWTVAGAQEHHDNGHHYGWRNHQRGQYANQCGSNQYNGGRYQNNRNDDDNDNDRDDNNGQYGQYGQYGQSGQYGQYGQNGQYGNCAGQYGGNAAVRGQIVGVNGNQVTLAQQSNANTYSRTITINDQPALNNQTTGRVSVGRYVTAYGYWQNGVFYATQMN